MNQGSADPGVEMAMAATQSQKVGLDDVEPLSRAAGENRRISVQDAETVENPLAAAAAKDPTPSEPELTSDHSARAWYTGGAQQQALIRKKALPSLLSFAGLIVSLCQTTGMVIDVDIPWPAEWVQVR